MHLYECSCMYVYICRCMEEEEGMHTYVHTRICTHIICVHMAVEEKEAQYIYACTLYAWKHMYPHYLDEHTCMQAVWCTWLWMCKHTTHIRYRTVYVWYIYVCTMKERARDGTPHVHIRYRTLYVWVYMFAKNERESARRWPTCIYVYVHTHRRWMCIYIVCHMYGYLCVHRMRERARHGTLQRGGGLGSRPKKMYGERLGDGVEYHLMSPTPRR